MPEVRVTIDGQEVTVPGHFTILEAAQAGGITIPTLCAHPSLKPIGACRMCLVEIEKARGMHPACTYPVSDGLVVRTTSPALFAARRFVLELLLSDHPNDCMTCDKCGDCELQDLIYEYGLKQTRYEGVRHNYELDTSNPFFVRDYNKCILCRRCVRACDEINGVEAINLLRRGFDTKIGTAFDGALQDSPCEFCGMCIALCPTGSLVPKSAVGAGRRWETRKVSTICPYCGVGCTIDLNVKGNKIVQATSNWEGAANKGWTCVKGRFGWDFVQNEERLTTPLIKKDGQFVPATWDEALDLVADKFAAIAQQHGPDALAFLSSAKCTNEENYLLQKLARGVIGTNNIDHCARL
jgi:formate dehydrogenase alpha subunit